MHEFLRDCEDLEDWINHQKQVVCSDGSGTDYEHVLVGYTEMKEIKFMIGMYPYCLGEQNTAQRATNASTTTPGLKDALQITASIE